MIQPLFNADDYLTASATVFEMAVNATQERAKPRASSLGACARQQAFMMAGVEPDPMGSEASARGTDNVLTAEQGRMFEDLSVKILEHMGVAVINRQITLPDNYPVTGHPDGELGEYEGLYWGFEHKHLGRWAYEGTLRYGLYKAEPNYVLQSALYGDALGWDMAQFVIVSQDSSSIRTDIRRSLEYKTPSARWGADPEIHPKVTIVPVDLRPLKHGLVPMALERATWLSDWKQRDGDPAHVARENNPTTLEVVPVPDGEGGVMEVERAPFPCGWCPYLQSCLAAGGGGECAPILPWTKDEDEV